MLTLFGVRSTPVLPQWHVKDSGHPAKSAGCRLHLNTHTPFTQRSLSGLTMPLSTHSVGTYPEMSSRNLSGIIWPQSSQLAEQLWTDPGLNSGISVLDLISTKKQIDKAQARSKLSNILPKSSQARKKPTTTSAECRRWVSTTKGRQTSERV